MQKPKKNISISSPKPKKLGNGKGLRMPGTDETFQRAYPGQDPMRVIHPGPVPEEVAPVADAEAALDTSLHKFPPPKNHPVFVRIWTDFIDNIAMRENFKTGHLNSLEMLCDLYVEYDNLQKFIKKNGRSYQVAGRQGMIWKFYPEVAHVKAVQSQIRECMKMLGLVLKKDHSSASGGEKSEWT